MPQQINNNQQEEMENNLPLGNSLGTRSKAEEEIKQRNMSVEVDNHPVDIYVGRFVKKYIKFKNECIQRDIFNLNEIIKLFEVYIKSL